MKGDTKDDDDNLLMHLAVHYDKEINIAHQLEVVKQIYRWYPKAIEEFNGNNESAYKIRWNALKKKNITTETDPILIFLKDRIMHLPDSHLIIRLLCGQYGNGELDSYLGNILLTSMKRK
jgi:hypothetical protein